MLSSPSHRVPMRVLPLINGACQGARRIYNYPRPHTFQLVIGHTMLHLAAPDEYVASDWLQALVHAASGVSFIVCFVLFLIWRLIKRYLIRNRYFYLIVQLIHFTYAAYLFFLYFVTPTCFIQVNML